MFVIARSVVVINVFRNTLLKFIWVFWNPSQVTLLIFKHFARIHKLKKYFFCSSNIISLKLMFKYLKSTWSNQLYKLKTCIFLFMALLKISIFIFSILLNQLNIWVEQTETIYQNIIVVNFFVSYHDSKDNWIFV